MSNDFYEHLLKLSVKLETLKGDLVSLAELKKKVENLEKDKSYYKGILAAMLVVGTIIGTLGIELIKYYLGR